MEGKVRRLMLIRLISLGIIGFSAGLVVAGGLFSFVVELGVVSDFADRTHTGDKIHWYEMSVACGGILGNLFSVFQVPLPFGNIILPAFGLLSGIFVGCWAVALAEILNVFPVFLRKIKTFQAVPWIIFMLAIGKGIGSIIYYYFRW